MADSEQFCRPTIIGICDGHNVTGLKLDAAEIDFAALRAAKLVPAKAKQAKIVKKGEITKKFVLKGVLATAGAKAAIEAAGGSVTE